MDAKGALLWVCCIVCHMAGAVTLIPTTSEVLPCCVFEAFISRDGLQTARYGSEYQCRGVPEAKKTTNYGPPPRKANFKALHRCGKKQLILLTGFNHWCGCLTHAIQRTTAEDAPQYAAAKCTLVLCQRLDNVSVCASWRNSVCQSYHDSSLMITWWKCWENTPPELIVLKNWSWKHAWCAIVRFIKSLRTTSGVTLDSSGAQPPNVMGELRATAFACTYRAECNSLCLCISCWMREQVVHSINHETSFNAWISHKICHCLSSGKKAQNLITHYRPVNMLPRTTLQNHVVKLVYSGGCVTKKVQQDFAHPVGWHFLSKDTARMFRQHPHHAQEVSFYALLLVPYSFR